MTTTAILLQATAAGLWTADAVRAWCLDREAARARMARKRARAAAPAPERTPVPAPAPMY